MRVERGIFLPLPRKTSPTFIISLLQSRVLKNDFDRYNDDLEGDDDQEDIGWKIIHTDVFRFPAYKSLFCAVLGMFVSSTQLLSVWLSSL